MVITVFEGLPEGSSESSFISKFDKTFERKHFNGITQRNWMR